MEITLSDEEVRRCTLESKREILFHLRGLIKQGERLTVTFGGGNLSFLTVLIDIDDEDDYLFIDVAGSPEVNRAFLNADHCVFTAIVEGIRYQFSAGASRETRINGNRVFAVSLPKTLLRLQRREFYRLALPSISPYICRIRRGSPDEFPLPLCDISVGGIGVMSAEPLHFESLERLENCWIDLKDSGVLAVTLQVRHIDEITTRSGKLTWRMGCRFMGLNSLNETLVQRFMARVEVERRSLTG